MGMQRIKGGEAQVAFRPKRTVVPGSPSNACAMAVDAL